MRRAARRDKNESGIVEMLKTIPGLSVVEISQKAIPDLLIGWHDKDGNPVNFLIEIKDKHGKLTPDQVEFHEGWNGQIAVCRTLEEVLDILSIKL